MGVTSGLRILWILPYSPWPTTSGGKTRQYQMLRSLAARGHRITLLMQTKQPIDATERAVLEPLLERLIELPRRPLRSLRTLVAALLSPTPLLASINGLNPELETTFDSLLADHWDIVQIEHSYTFQPYEAALRRHSQAFVLTEHNVESALGAATYDRLPRWALFFVRFDQWRYRRWERRVLSQASRLVAVTKTDATTLSQIAGQPVAVVVNGVDCDYFAAVRPSAASQRILFLGNYEYAPNLDAVEWALTEILPTLWKRHPEARFCVCGYALPASWAKRWPDPRIEWRGFVSDLPALQAECSVFLAPLRHGGGSKLKVLEAMAAGLPLVSTPQGVSGLAVEAGTHYLCGDDAQNLAEGIAQLLDLPATGTRIAEHGRTYVREMHDWSVAASQLEAVYADLLDRPSKEATACA